MFHVQIPATALVNIGNWFHTIMFEGVRYTTVVTASKYHNTCFTKAETTPHEGDQDELVWVVSGQAGVSTHLSLQRRHMHWPRQKASWVWYQAIYQSSSRGLEYPRRLCCHLHKMMTYPQWVCFSREDIWGEGLVCTGHTAKAISLWNLLQRYIPDVYICKAQVAQSATNSGHLYKSWLKHELQELLPNSCKECRK